jgi:hypothetical protein
VSVYGIRVVKGADTPVSEALNPLGVPAEAPAAREERATRTD